MKVKVCYNCKRVYSVSALYCTEHDEKHLLFAQDYDLKPCEYPLNDFYYEDEPEWEKLFKQHICYKTRGLTASTINDRMKFGRMPGGMFTEKGINQYFEK